ncbi:MAG: phosphatidylserine decarboxylase [Rubrobacteraceae bacterium]
MTARSWSVARRYVMWPLLAGVLALVAGRLGGLRRLRALGWASLGTAVLTLLFFRDPERRPEPEEGVIYAAADGRVTDVDEVEEPWLDGGRAGRVSVFLNLHNVHVNRSPYAGTIEKMEERAGGYAPALFGGVEENYTNRTLLAGERGAFVVVQRAGMIARRITPWVGEGQNVEAGERIGLIHFGSRTDVLLPPEAAFFLVRPGDKVRAGLTPIARYRGSG